MSYTKPGRAKYSLEDQVIVQFGRSYLIEGNAILAKPALNFREKARRSAFHGIDAARIKTLYGIFVADRRLTHREEVKLQPQRS